MKRREIILLFIASIFFSLPLMSANGLQLIGNNSISLNKTIGESFFVNLTIQNQEAFSFYNITLENFDGITIIKIPQLDPGQNGTLQLLINSNQSFNKNFKIKGFYQAQIGSSHNSYDINVDYSAGLSRCDFTIVKGDTITWHNKIISDTGTINMINAANQQILTSISSNSSYQQTFDSAMDFSYYFTRYAVQFTNACTITVLSDSGMVNNPAFDSNITINSMVSFLPTNLTMQIYATDYTLPFGSSQQGVLTLKNIGSNVAKNVALSGTWFSFSPNNFDISPGQSINVQYTMSLMFGQISTEETNKTYNQSVLVSGNFPQLSQSFNIFVPFANIGNASNSSGTSTLEILEAACKADPKFWLCPQPPQIIYAPYNASDMEFNVTYKANQVAEQTKFLFDWKDAQDKFNSLMADAITNMTARQNDLDARDKNKTEALNTISNQLQTSNEVWIFLGEIAGFICIGALLYLLIVREIKKRQARRNADY